ncbi:Ldh family oxidoreductase [Nitratireductor aestuarii]|nr:Ldh family oxidoreductase [Nitratireductor aestuarii]
MLISADLAMSVARALLERAGVPEEHARLQAEVLVQAELRGHASHGLQRLPRLLKRICNGLVNVSTTGRHSWQRSAYLHVEGEAGMGPAVAIAAIQALIARVPETGIAVAGISNSNHLGMLAPYVEQVAEAGCIGIALSSSEALVHPHGGAEAMLGTNPIAIAVPGRPGEPFVLDLATGIVSMGKVHDHALRGEPLEEGWALDAEGRPTTDAEAAKAGSLASFGGAKGFGLGLGFELLVASIAGSAFAPDVRGTLDDRHPANKGDVFIVIDPARNGLADAIAGYLDRVRNARVREGAGRILVPGDRARSRRQEALAKGINIAPALWSRLSGPEATKLFSLREEGHPS